MASLPVILGAVIIIGFLALGVAQTLHLPGSTLAGAATVEQNQQHINLCMNECMRGCVTDIPSQDACRSVCQEKCQA